MWAIYKRELKSCFCSFVGFLFIGVTLFFPGLYFTVYALMSGYPYYSYVVSSISFLFMITVPILTMRILAEERKNRTDQLILTAPVSVGAIVLGKFLALLTVFAIPTVITGFYPLIMMKFGTVPMAENYLALLAYFLYGMTSIALGVLVSSLTESQVIAAVLTFGFLFLGYMMSAICGLISRSENLLTRLLGCFDMSTPLDNLLNGTLDVGSVIYFLSLTFLFLFLTVQSIQKRRYSLSVKHFSLGAYSGISIIAAIAVTVLVNLVVAEMPGTWTSIDVTSQKLYSLTDQTKEFVAQMQEDVTIYVIVKEDQQDEVVGQTLQRYDDLSDHITVEYVDPTLNPQFYTQYTSQTISLNSLIVVGEKRNKVVDASDFYEGSYDGYDYSSYTVTGYDAEGQITSALAYVTSEDMPKLYLTEGHGEYALSSSYQAALEKENVEYETVNLMNLDAVPEDAACLLINAPQNDFNEGDRDKVLDYLNRGGKVIAVLAFQEQKLANYEAILNAMGVNAVNGMVVETEADHYYQQPIWLLPDIYSNAYTSSFYYDGYYVFAPYSLGLQVAEDTENITFQKILETSDSAYAKLNFSSAESLEYGEGDVQGPFVIAVEAVKDLGDAGEGTLVAVGCDEIFTDEADLVVGGTNGRLFTNIMSSFCAHEVNVSIPVKDYEISGLMVSNSYAIWIGTTVTVILPLAFLIVGLVIWLRRRKR